MNYNSFAKIYASRIPPNPGMEVLWMDLTEGPTGSVIKHWNGSEYIRMTGDLATNLSDIYSRIELAKIEAISESNQYTDNAILLIDLSNLMEKDASNSNVDTLTFNTSTLDISPLVAGQTRWNLDEGTLDLGMNGGGVVQSIGLELFYRVQNDSGVDIVDGNLIMATGTHGNSGTITVARATPDVHPSRIIGIATENIPTGTFGFVTWFGKVRGIETNGASSLEEWLDGDILYQHATLPGKLTKVKPLIGNKSEIAIVVSAHHQAGTIFVRIQRSIEFSDINDVNVSGTTNYAPLVIMPDGHIEDSTQITANQISSTGQTVTITPTVTTSGLNISGGSNDRVVLAGGGTISLSSISSYQIKEFPFGLINNENQIFTTTYPFIEESVSVYVNGLKEYNFLCMSDTEIMLDFAPSNIEFEDIIEVVYSKK